MDEKAMTKLLNWSYEKAVNGLPGMGTAEELARDYMKGGGNIIDQVNSLIRWQNTKCATSGFLTGVGGLITLPVAIPANISSVIYVQLRMIAAIAYMGGHDLRNDRVKTMAFACLCGSSLKDLLKDVGVQVGKQISITLIKRIPIEMIKEINKMVGFRLVTKFGQKGLINLGKAVPIVGGVIGGAIDGYSTNVIGDVAREVFIQ